MNRDEQTLNLFEWKKERERVIGGEYAGKLKGYFVVDMCSETP